jgi:agmatine deiminase
VRPGSWGKNPKKAQDAFVEIMKVLSKHEQVYLLADVEHEAEAKEQAGEYAKILIIESDDAWARDVGPTFVTDGEKVCGINWTFNAWGGTEDGLYADWDKDDKVALEFLKKTEYDGFDAGEFVLEGGSIHSDGEGTLLVTESCLLSKGRNAGMSKEQIEEKLKEYLGAEKVLWLPYGIYLDETNEHVDNVCAFIRPGEVVLAWTDQKQDPQYEMSLADLQYLEGQRDAKGRKLKIHKLPIPDVPVCCTEEDCAGYDFAPGEDMREPGDRLAASYVNFYFGNDVVLVPQFAAGSPDEANKASDERALNIMRDICKDREVVGIDSREILLGGGNIHCITQQIPKAGGKNGGIS